MSKIADATARPWNFHEHYYPFDGEMTHCENFDALTISIAKGDMLIGEVFAYVFKTPEGDGGWGRVASIDEAKANARLIVQAVNEREPLREMLFRALVELSYVQNVENCEGGLCASAEGKSIIEEGMKLLGVKDLSEDALKGEHNGD